MSNFLEIDPKILEKNLWVQDNPTDVGDFEKFLNSPADYVKDNVPWTLATPKAGFCVKTTDSNNKKVFINICKIDEIPDPKEISDSELIEIYQSEEAPDFKIPLSIQEPHDELDKSGNPCVAYDVALSTNFFKKVETNDLFKSFVLEVILESIEHKYNIELKKESLVILQNRKRIGELKPHRIRSQKAGPTPKKPLIQELSTAYRTDTSNENITKASYRISENKKKNFIITEFHLPKIATYKNINLDVGENRVVLSTQGGPYQADFFLPVNVDETKTTAKFNTNTRILTLKMPLIIVNS